MLGFRGAARFHISSTEWVVVEEKHIPAFCAWHLSRWRGERKCSYLPSRQTYRERQMPLWEQKVVGLGPAAVGGDGLCGF